ncbi:MAG: HAD-IA family hydrolase [Candidatus ainarchaeum sp.]|nr:HAD-IA family hydrolase [Candidatus ainarchaeum sp.]
MIKAIIFDISGVIVFNDLENILKKLSDELKIDLDLLIELEKQNHEKLILGKISIKEFCSSIRSRFNLEQDSLTLLLIWERLYADSSKLNNELIEKIKIIKKKFKVGAIANMFDSTAQFHQRQKLFLFFKPFLAISCRVGSTKTDSKMFLRIVSNMQVKENECLFIDDNENNLLDAKKKGMKILLFQDNKKLFKDLRKLKII